MSVVAGRLQRCEIEDLDMVALKLAPMGLLLRIDASKPITQELRSVQFFATRNCLKSHERQKVKSPYSKLHARQPSTFSWFRTLSYQEGLVVLADAIQVFQKPLQAGAIEVSQLGFYVAPGRRMFPGHHLR
jgi:hypothetical protein